MSTTTAVKAAPTKKSRKSRFMTRETITGIKRLALLMLVEGFGTFMLLMPTGIAAYLARDPAINGTPAYWTAVALAFGGVLALLVSVFGTVSGAHFNPAVTIALAVTDRGTDKILSACYVVAQLAGAAVGSFFVKLLVDSAGVQGSNYGSAQPTVGIGPVPLLLVEFTFTAVLMGVIARVTDPRHDEKLPPALIGLTLGVLVLLAGPFTGGAFNPARSLAPMLVGGQWDMWYLYVPAQLLGAIVGVFVYTRVIVAVTKP